MARKTRKNEALHPIDQITATHVYNTALYVRLSVMDGGSYATEPSSNTKSKRTASDGESIANQQELLERYVAEQPELTLKEVFIDNGETGTNFNRPAWNSLMRMCHQGYINCIVIKDLSRLGRNYIETGDYLERILPMLGVRLIAVNDCYDSQSLSNGERLVSNIKNLVNDFYAKDISRKVAAALRTKQKNGEFIGRYAAYGYLKDLDNPNKVVINPDTAPIVRKIFEMKAEGMGNGTICYTLNSESVPCPNRYRYITGLTQNNKYENAIWIISTVAAILRNPLYLGHMTQGKNRSALYEGKEKRKTKRDEWIIVKDTHEAIVTQELYDRANAVFDERSKKYGKNNQENADNQFDKSKLLLYGAAFCADCGKALARKRLDGGSNGKVRWVYGCKRHLDLKACTRKFINETDLYEAVYYAIRTQVQRYADVAGILEKLNRDNGYKSRLMHLDADIEEAEKELRRIISFRQAAYEDYAAKLLTASEYQFAVEKYNADMELHQNKLKASKAERKRHTKHTAQANKWLAAFSRFMDEKKLTLEIVQAMVDRVEVSDLNHVSITFKFHDELEALVAAVHAMSDDMEVAI